MINFICLICFAIGIICVVDARQIAKWLFLRSDRNKVTEIILLIGFSLIILSLIIYIIK